MTVAKTSPAWFTTLPSFGQETPVPPPRPMRLSIPVERPCRQFSNASIASKRHYHDDAVARGGAFAPYATVLAWIKRP